MKRLHLGALAASLLAGCGNLIPAYERPAPAVAPVFPDAPAADPGTPAAADIAWSDFFVDARLKRLIELALAHNRDLRVSVLAIERSRAQLQVTRADVWPTVGVGIAGSRQTQADGDINGLYTAGFSVSAWELDLFGRVRSLGEAAAAQVGSTEEARKAAQVALIGAVAAAHYSLLADERLLEVTRQTLATREDSLTLIRLKFDNGAASALELRQAESLLEGARIVLAQQTRQRALDRNALELLLGRPVPADLPPAVPIDTAAALPDLPAGVPSEVLTRRPDVRQAEQTLIAANANIGAARAAFFPRITLTGNLGVASDSLSGLFSDGRVGWSFAPQLVLPIFDAGRTRANLEVARVNREIALAQYDKAIQTAFREVADALAGRATLGEQLRAQQAQEQAEADRARLAELRWRNGAASHLDLLDAQRALFAAQQAVVQLRAVQAQNAVLLYRVLGGGWSEPVPAR